MEEDEDEKVEKVIKDRKADIRVIAIGSKGSERILKITTHELVAYKSIKKHGELVGKPFSQVPIVNNLY